MARPLVIEEESGTSRGHVHPHNGYYAASPSSDGGSDVSSLRLHPDPGRSTRAPDWTLPDQPTFGGPWFGPTMPS